MLLSTQAKRWYVSLGVAAITSSIYVAFFDLEMLGLAALAVAFLALCTLLLLAVEFCCPDARIAKHAAFLLPVLLVTAAFLVDRNSPEGGDLVQFMAKGLVVTSVPVYCYLLMSGRWIRKTH